MPPAIKSFLKRWLVNTLAMLVVVTLVHVNGIHYKTDTDLLIAALVLAFLNAFLRPLLMLLSLPLLIFTLGLFTLVINAFLLYFVGNIWEGFHVDSFHAAFWGGADHQHRFIRRQRAHRRGQFAYPHPARRAGQSTQAARP